MKCSNCNKEARRIRRTKSGERCNNCGLSVTGGVSTDGILTRQRTNQESYKHEADMILPWKKDQGKLTVNQDFAKRYPDKLKEYFYPEELRTQGYEKLVKEKSGEEV